MVRPLAEWLLSLLDRRPGSSSLPDVAPPRPDDAVVFQLFQTVGRPAADAGDGEYEHIRTLRDDQRAWTWFEGKFVATEHDVAGFEHDITSFHGGEVIDRFRDDSTPGDVSSLFVMDPGEFSTYEYAVQDVPVPTSFEVLVEQVEQE